MTNEPEPLNPITLPILRTLEVLKILNPLAGDIPRPEMLESIELMLHQGGGDLEALLATQSHVLDALFNYTLTKAVSPAEYKDDRVDLALRSQRQCRNAIETLRALQGFRWPSFTRQGRK